MKLLPGAPRQNILCKTHGWVSGQLCAKLILVIPDNVEPQLFGFVFQRRVTIIVAYSYSFAPTLLLLWNNFVPQRFGFLGMDVGQHHIGLV